MSRSWRSAYVYENVMWTSCERHLERRTVYVKRQQNVMRATYLQWSVGYLAPFPKKPCQYDFLPPPVNFWCFSLLVPIINFILNIKLLDRKMKHNVKIDSLFLQPEKLNVYKNDSDTSWDYTLTGM